jgi:peptidoglycan/xylan/chitin deacetylase (PgdA/CDA1 family)
LTPESFERQMQYLARGRYQVLSLQQMVEAVDGRVRRPGRGVVITFDDGYADNYTLAWPVLKRYGFPATIFVTVADLGRPGFLTWEQVQEMAASGRIEIGSHTMHHSYLPLVKPERLAEELIEPKRLLEARLGRPAQFISYPVGGFTRETLRIVSQAGYAAGCTTNRAFARNGVDRFALRRVKMTERDAHLVSFFCKVSGYYDLFRSLKQPG